MPDARWLDDDEMRAWRAFIATSVRLTDQLDRELEAQHGLSHDDYAILVNLSESPESRVRMSDLADRVLESKSRLSHHISRLEIDGLVRRERCSADRRGLFAVLTAEGRRRLEQAAPDHVGSVRRHFIDRLDRSQLTALADALEAVADPLGCPGKNPDPRPANDGAVRLDARSHDRPGSPSSPLQAAAGRPESRHRPVR